ncbi:MAG: hypothetical protein KF819_27680 [Labilithrix sp.]|nr:hypothetical protein [Labilithrix sp.]
MERPPKPKVPQDDLAEVERALSVLQGRHPEHERLRREDQAAQQKRNAKLDAAANIEEAQARSRRLRIALIVAPVALIAIVFAFIFRSEVGRRGRVEEATAALRALGFTLVDMAPRRDPGLLDMSVEPGCYAAVSTHAAPIAISRGGAESQGPGPALFCACTSERVQIKSEVDSSGGVALLRIDSGVIGGSRAFPFAPFKVGSSLKTDEACSEASFDAWLDAKKYPAPVADEAWLRASPSRAPLEAAGFRVVAVAKEEAPFVVIEAPKESCVLATSDAPSRLSIRMKGGAVEVPETTGTIGRCAQAESTLVVTREGKSDLVVLVAPAGRLGGALGMREVARSGGIAVQTTDVPGADLAWDAKQVLVASGVPTAIINTAATPDVAVDADARVVAVSFETPSALHPELPADVFSYCEPPLDDKTLTSLCVFSGSQRWRTAGSEAVGGLARSKLPFWLFTMQGVDDPVALKAMTQLFSLARKLSQDGFGATTLEAMTELPTGVEVLGRTGEDAFVAVGVAPVAPWVFPLTVGDAPAWNLAGDPQITPIKVLEKVVASAPRETWRSLPPIHKRRTVVFRRQKR